MTDWAELRAYMRRPDVREAVAKYSTEETLEEEEAEQLAMFEEAA